MRSFPSKLFAVLVCSSLFALPVIACSSTPSPSFDVSPPAIDTDIPVDDDPIINVPPVDPPSDPDNNTPDPPVMDTDSDIPAEDDPPDELPPIHTHSPRHVEFSPATCISSGNVEYYFCPDCDCYFSDPDCSSLLSDVSIPELGHEFGEPVIDVPPSCSEQGRSSRHCSRCDAVTDSVVLSELGHDLCYEVLSEPSCVDTGITLVYCSRCSYADEIITDTVEHSFVSTVTPPSCTQEGFTLSVCSFCGYSFSSDVTPALDHDFGDWEIVSPPSCTQEGVKQRVCSHDFDHVETESLPKTQHEFSAEFVYDESCHWHNAVCGCDLVSEPIPHEFTDNVCICGYERHVLEYELSSDGLSYTVTGIGSVIDVEIVIPSEYNGLPVVAVGSSAFLNNSFITKVTIPESVKLIGQNAFKGCSKLSSLVFLNTSGWFICTSAYASNGSGIVVSNPSTNASNIKSALYSNKFWKCK